MNDDQNSGQRETFQPESNITQKLRQKTKTLAVNFKIRKLTKQQDMKEGRNNQMRAGGGAYGEAEDRKDMWSLCIKSL